MMESSHAPSANNEDPLEEATSADGVAARRPSECQAALGNAAALGSAGRGAWPLCVFFGTAVLLMLAALPIVQSVGPWWDDFTISLVLGSILGSICVLCAFSGLWGRSWLTGYILASLLTTAGCVSFLLGEELRFNWQYQRFLLLYEDRWSELLIPAFFCPLFALAGIAPLLLLRGWAGWQLTRPGEPTFARHSSGVEELLIGTTVVSAALMIARSGAGLWEIPGSEFWLPLAIFCLIIATASLIGVVPAVWISTRVTAVRRRRLFLLGIAAVVIALASVGTLVANWIIGFSAPTGNSPLQSLFYGVVTSVPACAIFLFGLLVIRISGYQFHAPELVHSTDAGSVTRLASSSPLVGSESALATDEDRRLDTRQPSGSGRLQWQHRLLAGGLFGLAALCSLAARSASDRRADELQQLQELSQTLGGRTQLAWNSSSRRLLEIKLSSPDELQRVGSRYDTSELQRLSFAGGRFDDADLGALDGLSQLQSLDLSGTQISDSGIVALVRRGMLISLRELNLSNTSITVSGIQQLLFECNSSLTLDLRGLPIGCDQLAAMGSIESLVGLKLAAGQVTDDSLAALLVANDQLNTLDVSGCPVSDKPFVAHPRQYAELTLDQTLIDGPGVRRLLVANTVAALSLCEIDLDVVTLRWLLQGARVDRLELSDLRPLATGFQKAGTWALSNLTIGSPEFDGSCFAEMEPQNLTELDLSGSGVTDAALVNLDKFTMLQRLNLANTEIGDAGLEHLAKLSAYSIDLRGTRVTSAGLIHSGLSNKAIYLDIDQYSSQELQKVRQAIDARIGAAFSNW